MQGGRLDGAAGFRLIVSGGGTGGHVYPALTAVRALRTTLSARSQPAPEVLWVGQADSLEARVAAEAGIRFAAVAVGKIRRSRNLLRLVSRENVRDMARVPLGVMQARALVREFEPDAVLVTGGYVSVPVGMAAWLTDSPLVVHEQTVRLGLANKVLVGTAAGVALSSPSTLDLLPAAARAVAVVTGNPVRPEVLTGRAEAAARWLGPGWSAALPTVYVTGGSQGAAQINDLVGGNLEWLLARANVVHQCGAGHEARWRERAAGVPPEPAARYFPVGYLGAELPDVLALADVVVSRSGAGTIAELTALGKAAVYVPLPDSAGDEQAHNARHLRDQGAALALLEDTSARALRDAVEPLLADRLRREEMARRARGLGRPDAADSLVQVVLSAASRPAKRA
ncbi:UDP-N-acetylglucosamine--N-acetylmuramyl-(pentapeptide) pyrophosphoryl-undecaprenol N-acetylglucosamine transferase [Saccharothrix syringae]|uniref:UDP-N-acetylglucosamine--N-acetylmuramyl-(pentapeptide) pyrophosphoryl-undecaprenol N-acetylglucosamine transferase n=1 Tax=Saccharothrix syringae TaxID=103733 RepID=A0A5Q0HEI5_SACSY|nr:UDP-N-acetylglucosamine--N-acetylmuramyl-(pentapeptide) pyrophosphoryl-undecaprenol N-acetylglucosamine transferase [Saccharothrix syringae]